MSQRTVTVLTPNGRRQNVRVNPDTTILKILEDVCKKQGFEANKYDVRHHNKVLDTSCQFRFSGLPNNAQLEMSESTTNRQDSEVVLGLQLENGTRLIGNFMPDVNLWDALLTLCPEESLDNDPVLIYVRKEVHGENLKLTTLKSLGLSCGSAVIRLIHKKPEELKVQANVSAPIPLKPVEEKPFRRVLQRIESPTREENKTVATDIDVAKNPPEPAPDGGNVLNSAKEEKTIARLTAKEQTTREENKETDSTEKNNVLEDIVFLGERNALLFSLETAQAIPSEDLPEEFFELTVDDCRRLLRDIRRRTADLENNPLQTAAQRAKLEKSKGVMAQLNRYKNTIIRVQFPDRTVLQGTFNPTDSFNDVTQFVREYLEDKTMDFYLYTTPPKNVLNPTVRLVEASCVPTALVHFGCTLPCTQETRFLRSDLLDKFITSSYATLATSKMREQATRTHAAYEGPDTIESMDTDCDVNVGASTSKGIGAFSDSGIRLNAAGPLNKVPKWFNQKKK